MEETLNLIKRRYIHERAIYTWCGIALVAVNPYQEQDIYGDQVVETYHSASHSVYLQLDPHIYAIAEDAYSKLERNLTNQSIIVSGESGAGKTVSAKHTMRYLASIAASNRTNKLPIESRVLASNPIMEAIGNARTVRNDNSSRFGKYIQIYFDRHNRKILGANMRTYLLEKSRVTNQQVGERNFHIFYQLLNYAHKNPGKMEHLKLIDPDDENRMRKFKFLAGLEPQESRDDLRKFNEALDTLNIDRQRIDIIYRIIAGILHGGNIEFKPILNDQDDDDDDGNAKVNYDDCPSSVDENGFHFRACCELIGLDPIETKKCLTTKLLRSGSRDIIVQAQNCLKAEYARNAMLKYVYECLFTWLVALINLSLSSTKEANNEQELLAGGHPATINGHCNQVPKSPSTKKSILDQLQPEPQFIGVLDIYGFENFKTNSFEQFCINYANEVLQQQYNQHVFKIEQEEYIREGIDWTFIEYSDNQPVIDVIESRPIGILNLLDEECRMPKGSDKSWCAKLYDQLLPTSHTQIERAPLKRPKISYQNSFTICHYAEEVNYQVDTFLEKNRDTIAEEASELLRKSEVLSYILEDPRVVGPADQQAGGANGAATPRPGGRKSSARTNMRSATVGCQFRGSLAALIRTLNSTEPHYVRCIKPNDEKKAFEFNEQRAVQQLKACGVYETIRISNNGFPSRWFYKDFAKRYFVLIYGTPLYDSLCQSTGKMSLSSSQNCLNDRRRRNRVASRTVKDCNSNDEEIEDSDGLDDDDDGDGDGDGSSGESQIIDPANGDNHDEQEEEQQQQLKFSSRRRHFMCKFSSADIRPICQSICRIAYDEPVYRHLRTIEEQNYIDKLIERHGNKSSAIYQFGASKIFFRAGQVGYLERVRGQRLREFTVTIQRHVRGWLARKSFALKREQFLEQLRREASLASLQNQVQSLQTELEQVKEEGKVVGGERAVAERRQVSRLGSLYQLVVDMMYVALQPLVIGAILEYEALDSPEPFGSLESRSITPSSEEQPMEELLKQLDRFNDLLRKNSVPEDIGVQAFKQLFYFVCAQTLNQLLIRRDLCQFRKAMQINFNLSCLVQWCRERFLVKWRDIVEQLDPITQATKLLQTRKSSEDIATIEEVCNKLRPSQIIKILNMYTSSYEEQITTDFIHELEEYLDCNNNNTDLLMDTKFRFDFVDTDGDGELVVELEESENTLLTTTSLQPTCAT